MAAYDSTTHGPAAAAPAADPPRSAAPGARETREPPPRDETARVLEQLLAGIVWSG